MNSQKKKYSADDFDMYKALLSEFLDSQLHVVKDVSSALEFGNYYLLLEGLDSEKCAENYNHQIELCEEVTPQEWLLCLLIMQRIRNAREINSAVNSLTKDERLEVMTALKMRGGMHSS